MASGDTLCIFTPGANVPPGSALATLDLRNGHLVLDYDATTDESAVFPGVLARNYAGGGITVTLMWSASSATTGTCRWDVAFERMEDEGTDLDADSFATSVTAGGTAPATSGAVQYTALVFSSGAIDSLAVGESFRLRVKRDADGTSGTDDMAGDAELHRVELKET